jgi:predicted negative regulator of RcsB-dependent stress response
MNQISDNEQVQMLKDWWKEYGYYLLFTIVVFIFANFGWRYYQKYKYHQLENASINYMQMLTAFERQKNDEAKLYADALMKNYAKSSYASLAALMLAKIAVQANDLKLAQERLGFVIKKSSNKTLRQVARIRAARILIATKQPQVALDLLSTVDDAAYVAAVNEISGDALAALGKVMEANQAYQKAKAAAITDAKSPLLKLKMRQF